MKQLFVCVFSLISLSISAQLPIEEKAIDSMRVLANLNVDKAIKYGDSILKLDIENKSNINSQIGWYKIRKHKYKSAIGYFLEAASFQNKNNQLEELAITYIGLGKSYSEIDKIDEAIKYTLKSNKIARDTKDLQTEAYTLTLLSHIYYKFDDYQTAIQYNNKARHIQIKLQDSNSISTNMNDLAVIYERLNRTDSAMYYNLKALEINKLINKPYKTAISYNNIARIAQIKKDYNIAIDNYKKSVSIHEKLKTSSLKATKNLASTYLEIAQIEDAKNAYLKALKIAVKTKDFDIENEIYEQLLTIAITQKDYTNAQNYLKKRDSINAYILNIKNEEKIKLIDTQHKQVIKEEQLKQDLALNKKNQIIFTVLAGSLLFFGLFLFQKNRNSKLKLKQEKLVLEQKVLRTQMNPHFIFNALTSIQKTIFDNDPLKSTTYLSKFAKLIRQNFEFINKEKIFLSEDLDALKNYIETQQLRFDNKFEYAINIDKNIDPTFTKIPPMLLQPFIENAIEHGLKPNSEKGILEINISKKNDLFCFQIIDDGVGVIKKEKNKDREHAIDIFLKRLTLRKLGEEKLFSVDSNKDKKGTVVTFYLNLT